MSITSGTTFGHYTIIEAIRAGGMGEVFRALDTKLKREVAIKADSYFERLFCAGSRGA